MIEEIRDLFQNFIAPQLESIKGDIKALDAKLTATRDALDTKIGALDTKIDFRAEALDAKIDLLDAKIDFKSDAVEARGDALDTKLESYRREVVGEVRRVEQVFSTDFVRPEEKVDLLRLANMDTKLVAMNEKLDIHRRELLAEIRAALK